MVGAYRLGFNRGFKDDIGYFQSFAEAFRQFAEAFRQFAEPFRQFAELGERVKERNRKKERKERKREIVPPSSRKILAELSLYLFLSSAKKNWNGWGL